MNRLPAAPLRLLLWCAAGTVLVQLVLVRISAGNPDGFSAIFFHLLKTYDTHGNLLLLAGVLLALALRKRPFPAAVLELLAEHPWTVAAATFALLCLGSLRVYHAHPLSMDEYAAVFQAQAFAGGSLGGRFPPQLLDQLLPRFFQGFFFNASPATGEIASTYWPGFALLMAPFAWAGMPWAANPALAALTVPLLHRLSRELAGREAAGWAVALTLASPAFVVAGISYYSTTAHLFCNLAYALLLFRPTPLRAAAAGLIGSLALTLHNPVPHMLFSLPFFVWLALRPGRAANLAALLAGYLPLALLLGVGWHRYVVSLAATGAAAAPAGGILQAAPAVADTVVSQLAGFLKMPASTTISARIAGLAKLWTWAAVGLIVLAAWGYRAASGLPQVRVLAAALLVTFFGYFLVRFDQGHGWGYRYIHSAWFVLPVLAAICLAKAEGELRAMAAWAIAFSLVAANGLRLVQTESFIARQIAQVPPLAQAPADREIVFVDIRAGFYTQDMVQNDPFLRAPRVVMVRYGAENVAGFMARHFPAYEKSAEGPWGELWRQKPAN
jgi:hypothetical protein